MNVLVTGCVGFIGSHLTEKLLNESSNVIGIDNFDPYYNLKIKERNLKILKQHPNFKFVKGDINDLNLLKYIFSNNEINNVIHFGAKAGIRTSIQMPIECVKTNIIGSLNLLEACRLYDVDSFNFAGSSSVYGDNSPMPFTEDLPSDRPESPYAATKRAFELFGYTYHSLYDINFKGYRFFTVYGPRGRPDMAVYKFTNQIYHNKTVEIYGDGSYERDFTYVSDIVEGISLGMNKKLGFELFNLGMEKPISVNKLVQLIESILNKKANIKYSGFKKGDAKKTFSDISKAKNILGFNPKIGVEEGLKLFIDWYKKIQSGKIC